MIFLHFIITNNWNLLVELAETLNYKKIFFLCMNDLHQIPAFVECLQRKFCGRVWHEMASLERWMSKKLWRTEIFYQRKFGNCCQGKIMMVVMLWQQFVSCLNNHVPYFSTMKPFLFDMHWEKHFVSE